MNYWPTEKVVVDLPHVNIAGINQNGRILLDRGDLTLYLTKCAEALDDAGANSDVGKAIRVIRDSLETWQVVE